MAGAGLAGGVLHMSVRQAADKSNRQDIFTRLAGNAQEWAGGGTPCGLGRRMLLHGELNDCLQTRGRIGLLIHVGGTNFCH